MELRQLRAFLTVAELGSLSKAALVLGVTQPTVSRDIRLLEEELATSLFHRTGRGVTLSETGIQFRDSVQPHVAGIEDARNEILGVRRMRSSLRLGWVYPFSRPLGPSVLSRFAEVHPDIELHVRGAASSEVEKMVDNADIDIGVVTKEALASGPWSEGFAAGPLCHVSRNADRSVAPSVATGSPISLAEANADPLYLHGWTQPIRRALEAAARANATKLNLAGEMDEFSVVRRLVNSGAVSTITLPSVIGGAEKDERLLVRKIEPEIPVYFTFLFPRGRKPSQAARKLAKIILKEVALAIEDGRFDASLPKAKIYAK